METIKRVKIDNIVLYKENIIQLDNETWSLLQLECDKGGDYN